MLQHVCCIGYKKHLDSRGSLAFTLYMAAQLGSELLGYTTAALGCAGLPPI